MTTWLVTYYDGNENKAALIRNVSRENLVEYIGEKTPADFDVLSVLELHHDYFGVDWAAIFILDGVQFEVASLPEFGE